MGFIKSIQTSISTQMSDSYREVIKCDDMPQNIILKRVSTANRVISDQSRLFVQPGQCAIFVDNGAIKDIITEPGMYFMDSSAPTLFQTNIFEGIGSTFLESMKRVAYKGEVINQQVVYFISLTEKIGLRFNTPNAIIFKDPTWGPIEVLAQGQYSLKVNNPVNLLTNVTGDLEEYSVEQLQTAIKPHVVAGVTADIASLGVSFDEITKHQDELGEKVSKTATKELSELGVGITNVVVESIDVTEEVKKSMHERTAIKMKATSATDEEADIYAKLNKAEAMKDLANNPNSAGTTVMGMGLGNMFSGMINEDKKN